MTKFAFFGGALIFSWSALAQGTHPYNYPPAPSPLPSGACLWAMSPNNDWSLCHDWAAALGALSTTLDTQSAESPFAIPQTDAFKIVYRTNRTPQADTIAGFASGFGVTYFSAPQGNSVTPPGAILINGQFGYTFGSNQGAVMFFDGANYRALVGLPAPASQDHRQLLANDNTYTQVGSAQIAPGAVTTPALASGLNLSSPSITLGGDAPGDTYYRNSSGNVARLGIGPTNAVLSVAAGACTTDPITLVTTCLPGTPVWLSTISPFALPLATNSQVGAGKPDGSTINIDNAGIYHAAVNIDTVAAGITAMGTSQANCRQLTTRQSYINNVSANTGVCLPSPVAGARYVVCNETTTPVLIYAPADGSIINTPSGPLTSTQAVSVGRGCPEFAAKSTSVIWVMGAGVPLVVQ